MENMRALTDHVHKFYCFYLSPHIYYKYARRYPMKREASLET